MQRLAKKNLIFNSATLLSASSEEAGLPVDALQDQQRQNFWRSALGWTIITGFNDRIDFDRGGVKVATITAGHYATAALFAAAVVAALELIDSTPVWACSYNSSTGKFTISTAAHNFSLLFDSGANLARAARLELGWDFTDTASALTHTAENEAYQSQHYIRATVPAGSAITVAAIAEHNFSSDPQIHNVLVQWYSDSAFSVFVASEDLSDVNVDDPQGTRRLYVPDRGQQYLQLVIQDTRNLDGFAELGIWWLSDYLSIDSRLNRAVTDDPEDFSRIEQGPDGTVYVDFGRSRSRFGLTWRPLSGTDLDGMRDFLRDLAAGEAWLLDLQHDSEDLVFYGSFMARPRTVTIAKTPTSESVVITFEFVVHL